MKNRHLPKSFTILAMGMLALPAWAGGADVASQTMADTVKVAATYMGKEVMATPAAMQPAKDSWFSKVRATGAIQSEFLFPQEDKGLGIDKPDDKVLNNTYVDLTINAPYISVGGRFEWARWPLPGFPADFGRGEEKQFNGFGVPYIWATGSYKWAQLTVGDFYEQFGSGLILRTYTERSLGKDNAIRGGRLKLQPVSGLHLTMLGGKQRRFWEHNAAWLWGGDAEWSLDETFSKAFADPYGVTLGVSYVGKHEPGERYVIPGGEESDYNYLLRFPKTVGAFDGRIKLRLHDFSILAEGAYKSQDPGFDNSYTYRKGHAELLSVTYASKGFSAYLQAKRSENMDFRSKRSDDEISSFINHLPAFTMTQTYALAAIYPYATQSAGEWAFQGEVRYHFKKGTPLGGKFGTYVRLTGSYISGLDKPQYKDDPTFNPAGTDGYGSAFWKIGELYYADLNFEVQKKLSKKFQFTLFYLFQKYNQEQVEGHGVNGAMVTANTFIAEGQWKIAKKTQLRFELQYLNTKQDLGDWLCGLVELSLAPHWMFTFQDMYNAGTTKLNYYNAMVTYNLEANRFTLGYGRTRAGYNCSGGVCRWVPATKGFSFTYNYTF